MAGPAVGAAEAGQGGLVALRCQQTCNQPALMALRHGKGAHVTCGQGQAIDVPVRGLVLPEMAFQPGGHATGAIGAAGINIGPGWKGLCAEPAYIELRRRVEPDHKEVGAFIPAEVFSLRRADPAAGCPVRQLEARQSALRHWIRVPYSHLQIKAGDAAR